MWILSLSNLDRLEDQPDKGEGGQVRIPFATSHDGTRNKDLLYDPGCVVRCPLHVQDVIVEQVGTELESLGWPHLTLETFY